MIKKDILVLGKDPTQRLDVMTITAEAEYSINFWKSQRKFCLHYNESKSFLFVNALRMYQYKAKDVFLSNQKCEIQPTVINLHPNEYSQELH